MIYLRTIREQRLTSAVAALIAASAVCCALVAYRIVTGAYVWHAYLIWNLFLAWLPLAFALAVVQRFERVGHGRDMHLAGLAMTWLLFFPNSPYIFTDVVHVLAARRPSFWSELMLILLCAMTGFLAGFLSLQIMHGLATKLWGRANGWLFVALTCGLTGFGVYLGRFTRLNSWDVLVNPVRLVRRTSAGAWNLVTEWHHTKFLILFSLFLLLGYMMLFALTQTKRVEHGRHES